MRRGIAAVLLLAAGSLRGEILEVTRADDDRLPGSLRWAIEQSNALPGRDEIRIIGPLTIQPKSALPPLRDTVILMGSSENEVWLDGVDAGAANGIAGLAPGVMIHGVRVIRFNGAGIEVYGDRSSVADCIVRDNAGDGIVAGSGAWVSNNRIDANRNGIRVEGEGAIVVTNTIGFDAGNRENGIWVTASASKALIGEVPSSAGIGGMIPHTNWIYRSGAHGVLVDGAKNTVGGNVIGSRGKANALHGIFARGDAHIVANDTSYNGRAGVAFMKSGSVESVYGCCNGGLLLDIGGDGPSPNDPGDLDDVPNAPRILWGLQSARAGWVTGELHARPSTKYRIDLLGADGRLLNFVRITTDATGFQAFSVGGIGSPLNEVHVLARRSGDEALSEPVGMALPRHPDDRVDIDARGVLQSFDASGNVSMRVTITNRGPAVVDDVQLTLPGAAIVSAADLRATTERGNCMVAGRICRTGLLGPGESVNVTITLRPFSTSPFDSFMAATVTVPYTDPDLTNNAVNIRVERRESRRRAVGR